jgi:hypothetical protein
MKKFLLLSLALASLGLPVFALNENVVVWEQIYGTMETDEQRLNVMLKITEFKDRDFIPVMVSALEQLSTRRMDEGTPSEQYSRVRLARLIIQQLGDLKSIEADESVFRIYTEATDPDLKADAAVALGHMHSTGYTERLSKDLASINLAPIPAVSRNQEIIALGIVKSLEAMHAIEGYEAVFMASTGWYSAASNVRQTALDAMKTMVDDPTDSLLSIIRGNPSFEIKSAALAAAVNSQAPAERKAVVATAALRIGLDRAANDVASAKAVSQLRSQAVTALSTLKDRSADTVPLLVELIKLDKKNDASLDETLRSYVALGVNGSEEACRYLSDRLAEYSAMEKVDGNTVRDKTLIRQIVASMALTGSTLVKPALIQGLTVDYDTGILRLMEETLAGLPK